jgi:hypothetical protein
MRTVTYSTKLVWKIKEARAQLRHTRRNNCNRYSSYWAAAIYLVDLYYGGPEEGGWYYTSGERKIGAPYPFPIYWNAGEKPTAALKVMDEWCTQENMGTPDIDSVLSVGRHEVKIFRNQLPTHYPSKRPYYS